MNYLNTEAPLTLFKKTLKQKIYVDKSLLIDAMNELIGTGDCYVCITRPRRFGKTINANMLGAYYTRGFDSHPIFDELLISNASSYEEHLNQHNVIYIDFSRMPDICRSYEDYISFIKQCITADFIRNYNITLTPNMSINAIISASSDSFIFILDEWDSIFYEDFMTPSDKNAYLKFLKNLLKDQPYVDLAYMTGILPIAKYSSGSELNMFDEFNFTNDNLYDDYFGFQEHEVIKLCDEHQTISYDELKQWYDGYFTSSGKSLFNPRSVSKAITRGICLNYWTETGPMNEIAECIEHNVDAVREDIVKLVAGIPIPIKLSGYSAAQLHLNTRDEILSAMVVYGFLSYYDGLLRIPNHELMEKFQSLKWLQL